MKKLTNKKGMVGITIAIVILSLLMSVSVSYIKVVQVNSEIQDAENYGNKAIDAAFSGISYVVSVAQDNFNMFKTGNREKEKRTYFVMDTTNMDDLLSTINPKDENKYENRIKTSWIYVNEDLTLLDNDNLTEKPYQFRVVSYPMPDPAHSDKIDDTHYLIKSQGKFRTLNEDGTTNKEYKCQIIAEIIIKLGIKVLKINRWRIMEWQNDTDFNKYTAY